MALPGTNLSGMAGIAAGVGPGAAGDPLTSATNSVSGSGYDDNWAKWAFGAGNDLAAQYMDQYGTSAMQQAQQLGQDAQNNFNVLAHESLNQGSDIAHGVWDASNAYAAQQQQQGAYMGQQLANAGAAYGQALQGAGAAAQQGALAQAGAMNTVAGNVEQTANQAYIDQQKAASAAQKYGLGQAQTLGAVGQQAGAYGQDAAYAQQAAGYGAGGYGQQQALATQRLAGDSAAGLNRLGGQLMTGAQTAAQRSAIDPNFMMQNRALTEAGGTTNALTGLERTEGPSAAQAQLQSGLNAAQASNLAMARSGRGWGGSASALRDASVQNAAAGQQAANQAAILRAQENAAWRQRQAANLSAGAGLQQAAGQQYMGQQQLATQAGLQSRSLNDQQQQALLAQAGGLYTSGAQLGLQGQVQGAQIGQAGQAQQLAALQNAAGTGQNAYAQQIAAQQAAGQMGQAAYGQQLAGLSQAEQNYLAGQGQTLGALQGAGQLAQSGYGQNLSALQGAAGVQLGAQQAGAGLAQSGLNAAAGTAVNGMNTAAQIGLGSVGQAGQLYGMGVGAGFQGQQQAGQVYGAYNQNQQQGVLNALNAYATQQGVASQQAQAENNMLAAGLQTGGALLGGIAGTFFGGPAGTAVGAAGGAAAGQAAYQASQASDERTKTDIAEADADSLDLLDKAPGYTYRYKDTSIPGTAPGKFLGPMAQDLEKSELGASMVTTGPDGLKRVDGGRAGLAALGGLSALKRSHRAELDRLSREIDALKRKRKAA